jgi:hypothetical protein
MVIDGCQEQTIPLREIWLDVPQVEGQNTLWIGTWTHDSKS